MKKSFTTGIQVQLSLFTLNAQGTHKLIIVWTRHGTVSYANNMVPVSTLVGVVAFSPCDLFCRMHASGWLCHATSGASITDLWFPWLPFHCSSYVSFCWSLLESPVTGFQYHSFAFGFLVYSSSRLMVRAGFVKLNILPLFVFSLANIFFLSRFLVFLEIHWATSLFDLAFRWAKPKAER